MIWTSILVCFHANDTCYLLDQNKKYSMLFPNPRKLHPKQRKSNELLPLMLQMYNLFHILHGDNAGRSAFEWMRLLINIFYKPILLTKKKKRKKEIIMIRFKKILSVNEQSLRFKKRPFNTLMK